MSEPLKNVVLRPRVECRSTIVGVVLHGRGAVVTRRVEIEGELPSGPFDVAIGSITPLADPGSVRARLPEDARTLVAIDTRMHLPEKDSGPGESVQRVQEIDRKIERLTGRQAALEERANRLRSFVALPRGKKALKDEGPASRVAAAFELSEVAAEALAGIDQRLVDLEFETRELRRERERLLLEDQQRSSAERVGEGHPTREFLLHIAGGASGLPAFEISYAVPYAAKWWPIYTLRLTDGGERATLTMEALVAQRTLEDWTDVQVGLSTSEIIFDATLPRLASLRLGKRQSPPRTGFREPPGGLDRLFESYDAFMGRREPPASQSTTRQMPKLPPLPQAAPAPYAPPPSASYAMAPMDQPEAAFDDDEPSGEFLRREVSPPVQMQMATYSAAAAPMRKRASIVGAVGGMVSAGLEAAGELFEGAPGGGGGFGGPRGAAAPTPEPSFEPTEDWLEFDSLVLGGADESPRGRLRKRAGGWQLPTSELYDAQESARRLSLVDPAVSRGLFDYRYDAEGAARIPADGRLHRFELTTAQAPSRLVWRTVPVEDPQVYREAEFDNPFVSPLLAGPIDVFSEGQLVTTTHVDRVAAGGSMRVGLGVDERIRVARNVRMTEESAGLLGGKRELRHAVEIELRSALGFESRIEVFDRIPVSDDENVNVEMLSAEPSPVDYDQKELSSPIKGGKKWSLRLDAGSRRKIEYSYCITLRSKDEIVGGNRRD